MRFFKYFSVFCLTLTFLCVNSFGGEAFSNEHCVRIEYYQMALESQKKALATCKSEISRVDDGHTEQNATNESNKRRLKRSLVSLRNFYLGKIIGTLKRLAREHELAFNKVLNEAPEELKKSRSKTEHLASSANLWEEIGTAYLQKAQLEWDRASYDSAAGLNETAFNSFKTAQIKWHNYVLYSDKKEKNGNARVKDYLKNNFFSGLEALRAASDSHYQSHLKHLENARQNTGRLNINTRNAGDEWIRAASAHENYERLNTRIRKLEKNAWKTFAL